MKILAIDPGSEQSALLLYDTVAQYFLISHAAILGNTDALGVIKSHAAVPRQFDNIRAYADVCVIEMVACYGMPVGKEVFQTCVWIGRFLQAWAEDDTSSLMYRKDVKMHLCNSMRAKDGNIRQALIDRFGPGRAVAIGTKKKPGPLYGLKKDLWSALALAVTFADTVKHG